MAGAAEDAQADSSLQHSVLVESISAIETLKAARAEGQMLGRWRRYSGMSATTQERMRRLMAVIGSGRVNLDGLVTDRFGLDDI